MYMIHSISISCILYHSQSWLYCTTISFFYYYGSSSPLMAMVYDCIHVSCPLFVGIKISSYPQQCHPQTSKQITFFWSEWSCNSKPRFYCTLLSPVSIDESCKQMTASSFNAGNKNYCFWNSALWYRALITRCIYHHQTIFCIVSERRNLRNPVSTNISPKVIISWTLFAINPIKYVLYSTLVNSFCQMHQCILFTRHRAFGNLHFVNRFQYSVCNFIASYAG